MNTKQEFLDQLELRAKEEGMYYIYGRSHCGKRRGAWLEGREIDYWTDGDDLVCRMDASKIRAKTVPDLVESVLFYEEPVGTID